MRPRSVNLVVLGAVIAVALVGSAATSPRTEALARCGVERWSVKTLSDPAASQVSFAHRATTVDFLRSRADPHARPSTPRLSGVERTTYRVSAQLVEFKREADQDIHLVIASPRSRLRTMIVEFPNPSVCAGAAGSAKRAAMLSARRSVIAACGLPPTSSFAPLRGSAAITGVGFFDVRHPRPQRGVAPNQIELHPVLAFRSLSCRE
jgi:hypothetical protein